MQKVFFAALSLGLLAASARCGSPPEAASPEPATVLFGFAGPGIVLQFAKPSASSPAGSPPVTLRPVPRIIAAKPDSAGQPPVYVQPVPVVIARPACARPKPFFSLPVRSELPQGHPHSHPFYCR